jgi:hypothetical protein
MPRIWIIIPEKKDPPHKTEDLQMHIVNSDYFLPLIASTGIPK